MWRKTISYWFKEIIRGAISKAWSELGIRAVLIELGASITASVLYHQVQDQLASANELLDIGLLTLLIWIILLFLTVLAFAIREPFIREQDLNKRLSKWEGDRIKADFEVTPKKQLDGHLSLEVINNEGLDLTNCFGRVVSMFYVKHGYGEKDITDELNPNGLPLTWGAGSEGGKKTIHRDGGKGLLNIAKHDYESLDFIFNGLHGEVKCPREEQGIYKFEISIDGEIEGKLIQKKVVQGHLEFQRYYKEPNGVFSSSNGDPDPELVPDGIHANYYYTKLEIREG